MKLAIVTETFPPDINGVAMTFGHIAHALGRRGHVVTIYRPRPHQPVEANSTPPYSEIPMPGCPIPGYPLMRFGLPARGRFLRDWRADRPDLVHVVTEGPLGSSAISAARQLGIPVTSSFHTNFHRYTSHYRCGPLHRITLAWLRRVHNRTLATFAPTQELCEELAALGFRELRVLSRGVDVAQFSPAHRSEELRAAWGAAPDDPVVLHVGRVAAEKNYPLLFRAFAAMQLANPRCRFVLVGDGPLRPSLERAHPECRFAGFVSREDLARYYASADIYLHASRTETFGNVLTEAMASGLAVATFDYAAARQFVRDGVNGLAVPLVDPDALIGAAVALATSAVLRHRLRAAARLALAHQSWEHVIGRFEEDLLQLIRPHEETTRPAASLAHLSAPAPATSEIAP